MKKILKMVLDWIVALAIALAIFFIVSAFISLGQVSGESMNDTYQNGEKLLVQKKFYNLKKNDVITFWTDKDAPDEKVSWFKKLYYNRWDLESKELHLKRVLGLPGDKIKLEQKPNYKENIIMLEVYINDELVLNTPKYSDMLTGEYTLAEDEYFVIGDNYTNSTDSRMHGPVKKEDIFGEILFTRENTQQNINKHNNQNAIDIVKNGQL